MCWTVIIPSRPTEKNGIGNVLDLAAHNIAHWTEIIRSLGVRGIALYAARFVVRTGCLRTKAINQALLQPSSN
jgi:hypothetical protein